jgi:hypothetical protein
MKVQYTKIIASALVASVWAVFSVPASAGTCPEGICADAGRSYTVNDSHNYVRKTTALSNVSVSSVAPIPAAVWLFASSLGFLGVTGVRKATASDDFSATATDNSSGRWGCLRRWCFEAVTGSSIEFAPSQSSRELQRAK